MALTYSNMFPLGEKAPHFTLPDTVSGEKISLSDTLGEKGLLVIFMCNHCPYVQHLLDPLVDLIKKYQAKGVGCVAISSNDIATYPADAPDMMAETAQKHQFSFPYLLDETQEVAKSYQAACTPDFYLFDANQCCVYRGRFDDSSPKKDVPVTGEDLIQALEALLAGTAIPEEKQRPSMGCNIKWLQD